MKHKVPHGRGVYRPAYIFRPWITNRSGRKIYARDYGLRAFRIRIR